MSLMMAGFSLERDYYSLSVNYFGHINSENVIQMF